MLRAHPTSLPSHLILRILLPNWLNSGPGLLVFSPPYPKAPDFMSLFISTVPGSPRGRDSRLGSPGPAPVASPPSSLPVLSTHPCV